MSVRCWPPRQRGSELLAELSRYGLPLGDAFQLRDDVIGAFGDASMSGKPVGDDLREGKPTPLLARGAAGARPDQRETLERVGAKDLDEHDIAAIQQVLIDTGALADVESRIVELATEAVAALDAIDLRGNARRELTDLAAYVVGRAV